MGYIAQSAGATRPVSVGTDDSDEKSLFGFLGNVLGDVGEFAQGGASLLGILGADAARLIAAPFTGEDYDFATDDLVKALPGAILDDYQTRYGSVEGFTEGLYEDPLAFAGDVLTLLTLGGGAAARGAQFAATGGKIAKELEALAAGTKSLDEVSDTTRLVKTILPGAGTDEPGGVLRILDRAGRVEEISRPLNPVKRAAHGKVYERVLAEPVETLKAEVAKLDDELLAPARAVVPGSTDPNSLPAIASRLAGPDASPAKALTVADSLGAVRTNSQAERLQRLLEIAEAKGATHIYRAPISDAKLRKVADKLFGRAGAHFIDKRQQFIGEASKILEGLDTKTDAENFHALAMFDPPESAGRMDSGTLTDTITRGPEPTREALEALRSLGPDAVLPDGRLVVGSWRHVDEAARRVGELLEQEVVRVTGPAPGDYRGAVVELADGSSFRLQTPQTARMAEALAEIDGDIDRMTGELQSITSGAEDAPVTPEVRGTPHDPSDAARAVQDDVERRAFLEREIRNAHRYKEHLGEAIAAEMRADLEGVSQGALADAMDRMRWLLHDRITGEAIRRNLLTYTSAVERAYGPSRKAFLGSFSEDAGRLTDDLEAARVSAATPRKAPLYFPMMDPRRVRYSDFALRRASRGMLADKPRALKRAMGELIDVKDGSVSYIGEHNPLEAYSRMAAQMLSHFETQDLTQGVLDRFARRLEPGDELAEGEAVFNPHALRRQFDTKAQIDDRIFERLNAGDAPEDAFADAIQQTLPKIQGDVEALLAGDRDLYAIPKVVAERLDKFVSSRTGWKARLFWDSPMNMWRSLTLLGSPRWVLNNLLGNVVFLKMQGGRLSDVARQAIDPAFRKRLEALVPEGVEGGFFSDASQYVPHMGAAEKTAVGQAALAAKSSKPWRAAATYAQKMRRLNQEVEDAFRRASYLKGVERELSRRNVRRAGANLLRSEKRLSEIARAGADEKVVRRAVNEVNEFFNDYTALSPFERNVIRRFFVPFWSFYKHQAKLALSFPVKHPGRFTVLDRLADLSREMGAELGPLPEWLEGAIPISDLWGADPGEERFLTTGGADPFRPLEDFPLSAVSALGPVWKVALEQATGRDSFTGEKFTAPNVVQPFGSERQFAIDPTSHTVTEVDRVAPNPIEHLLSQAAPVDALMGLMAGGARYGTGEAMADDAGRPLYPTNPLEELLRYAGIPTRSFDVVGFQERLREEQEAALRDYQRRVGAPGD